MWNWPSYVITPSSRKVRMISCASLTRENGLIVFQSTPYCVSIPKLPQEMTPSARPPVSSSSVASAWQMSVGSRR